MRKHLSFSNIPTVLYFITFILFTLFALCMVLFESNTVYSPRNTDSYVAIENYTLTEIVDSSAPMGIRKEYKLTLDDIDNNDQCLAFYVVHCYAEVYFDDELVYGLMPQEGNSIGKSPSSNWVTVPLRESDYGTDVRIVITPVFESAYHRQVTFYTGPLYAIMTHRLELDFPQLALAGTCLLTGLVVSLTSLYFILSKKNFSSDLFYLGNVAMMIGIWRFTDTRISPVLFPNVSKALGYITLESLFLVMIPFLLLIGKYCNSKALRFMQFALCVFDIGILACQVTGVAELRQMLILCHIMIGISLVLTLVILFLHMGEIELKRRLIIFLVTFGTGAVFDLAYFYLKGNSSGLIFSITLFLIYVLIRFVMFFTDLYQKAYKDIHTGLFNREHWDKVTASGIDSSLKPVGIMLFDLNKLKYVNDTYGHTYGDEIIFNFANILSKAMPKCTVCRWGGDEFTVIVNKATREIMDNYINEVASEVEAHNSVSDDASDIHYAVGYVLSSEFPDLTCHELLWKADERMYINKHEWYEKHEEFAH